MSVRTIRPALPLPVVAPAAVPLLTGGTAAPTHLDVAASAPCLQSVADAVADALPWYASVHRGAGFASTVSGNLLDGARAAVARFAGARTDDHVIFTRNTTDALTLLAHCLPADTEVFTFDAEHHANLLPWRTRRVRHLRTPDSASEVAQTLAAALTEADRSEGGGRDEAPPRLVAVTGASNVTGERWPIAEIVRVARAHGARVVVDAAQLAAHAPVDLAGWGADWVAFSGHKIGAPFGAGALIGRAAWLADAEPYLPGGGAASIVTVDSAQWVALPARHEGGTPNVLGAVALGAACAALISVGPAALTAYEDQLATRLRDGLADIPGVRVLRLWSSEHPAVGVVSFVVDGIPSGQVAAVLSAEHGIAVRAGRFCAHPLVDRLVSGRTDPTGAVRASIGPGTRIEEVELLLGAVATLCDRVTAELQTIDQVRNIG